jgi:hypothetical protein
MPPYYACYGVDRTCSYDSFLLLERIWVFKFISVQITVLLCLCMFRVQITVLLCVCMFRVQITVLLCVCVFRVQITVLLCVCMFRVQITVLLCVCMFRVQITVLLCVCMFRVPYSNIHEKNNIWIFLCFNATFSNISTISWRPVLVVEEAGVSGESHRPWESNW